MMISLQGTSLIKVIVAFFLFFIMVFVVTGMLTSLKPEYRITSSSLNQWTENFSGASLIHLFGFENPYYTQALPEDYKSPKVSTIVFEMATNINPDDPRSLLGRELPGFSLYDGKILVAGEGTNYTNMPSESAPPVEVLLKEREVAVKNMENAQEPANEIKKDEPALTTNGEKVVFIYATHSRESYLPMLEGITDPNEAYHSEANVMMVGKKLAAELESQGIGTSVDQTDHTGILLNKGWDYMKQSYDVSRPVIKDVLSKQRSIKYVIDIHRDALPKKHTTVTINGKSYARVSFVIGGEHQQYEKNQKLATDLHHALEGKFPGISRGVMTKQGPGTNGKFNQDLSQNAILIEFGGVHNTFEEVNETIKAFSKVFSEFYWQAEKVNG